MMSDEKLTTPESDEARVAADDSSDGVEEPDNALPEISIDDLPEGLRDAANRAGWTALVPVQAKAIPYIRADRDLMVQSRTGSGKTGAFILPILEKLDPDLPESITLTLEKMLAADPEDRFADSSEVADKLEQSLKFYYPSFRRKQPVNM